MTGETERWQDAWSRRPDGSVRHTSGLVFLVDFGGVNVGEEYGSMIVDQQTLKKWQALELSRGALLDELKGRQEQLRREAARWHVQSRYGSALDRGLVAA